MHFGAWREMRTGQAGDEEGLGSIIPSTTQRRSTKGLEEPGSYGRYRTTNNSDPPACRGARRRPPSTVHVAAVPGHVVSFYHERVTLAVAAPQLAKHTAIARRITVFEGLAAPEDDDVLATFPSHREPGRHHRLGPVGVRGLDQTGIKLLGSNIPAGSTGTIKPRTVSSTASPRLGRSQSYTSPTTSAAATSTRKASSFTRPSSPTLPTLPTLLRFLLSRLAATAQSRSQSTAHRAASFFAQHATCTSATSNSTLRVRPPQRDLLPRLLVNAERVGPSAAEILTVHQSGQQTTASPTSRSPAIYMCDCAPANDHGGDLIFARPRHAARRSQALARTIPQIRRWRLLPPFHFTFFFSVVARRLAPPGGEAFVSSRFHPPFRQRPGYPASITFHIRNRLLILFL
ncbi:hypothetical protein B0H19DRAFT_1274824 [Mycena capillaripes]|nr:hypothetical protein B0H19DRAFT_1274824 [Mycena capillaripes]